MYNLSNDWVFQQYVKEISKPKIHPTDFYYDENGQMVMTESYHLKRGKCCNNGCKHCPYKSK
jgi:hypothetical protein